MPTGRGAPAGPGAPGAGATGFAAVPVRVAAPGPGATWITWAVPPVAVVPSPAAPPPARSPDPPPSACPPLTDPAASPRFVPDRLRTTLAPRIGKADLDACRAATTQAATHPHPSFLRRRLPPLGSTGRPRPHSRVTKRVRTYNHLLGARHGAFASKQARSCTKHVAAAVCPGAPEHASYLVGDKMVTPRAGLAASLDLTRSLSPQIAAPGHGALVSTERSKLPLIKTFPGRAWITSFVKGTSRKGLVPVQLGCAEPLTYPPLSPEPSRHGRSARRVIRS